MRVLVRLIAVLAGLMVVVVGALLAAEVVWAALRPGSNGLVVPWNPARALLESLAWNNTWVRVVAVVLMVVGLLLLLVAAKSGRRDIRLRDPAPDVVVITDPQSLARFVGHQVREQHGVVGASVTATPRRIRVSATSRSSELGDMRGPVTESVQHSVEGLPLQRTPEVSVSVSPAKERQ